MDNLTTAKKEARLNSKLGEYMTHEKSHQEFTVRVAARALKKSHGDNYFTKTMSAILEAGFQELSSFEQTKVRNVAVSEYVLN